MKKYELGSNTWCMIGSMNMAQRNKMIDHLEMEICKNKAAQEDEKLYWLTIQAQEDLETVSGFHEYKERSFQLERLAWLREKNVEAAYSHQQSILQNRLEQALPKQFIDDLVSLLDLAVEKKADLQDIRITFTA